jgi:hypothetical protein
MSIENYHTDALRIFRNYKQLAERAMEQVSDDDFFRQIDEESNSIAILVKHIAGNLHSRWTDFLTTDGEKPNRHRDNEFELIEESRESLMWFWEGGWQALFDNTGPLTVEDFEKNITIRGEPHTIVEAINRQMAHCAMHVGQIIFLAKHLRSSEWKTLSIPRNRSSDFNKFMSGKKATSKMDPLDVVDEFPKENEGPA